MRIRQTLAVAAASLTLLAACGGGSSMAPTKVSLSGDEIPVKTLTTGLLSMCTVAHEANNVPIAGVAYFNGPYGYLHELAGVLHGKSSTGLLDAMETFETGVRAKNPSASDTVTNANKLLGLVDTDLVSLKIAKLACPK